MFPDDLRPSPLELAAGVLTGWSPPPALPAVPASLTPLAALEEALVPALERGRCCVAFSGGRDSSAMLAAAVGAARRHGLAPPVPLTLRFAAGGATEEAEWQELVIGHLRLDDWLRIDIGDELDILGPMARAALLRHRLPWPGNGHAMVPLMEAAHGGSLVSGAEGDTLLDGWQWGRRPGLRGQARVAKGHLPRAVRRLDVEHRRQPFARLGWLTEHARRAVVRLYAREEAAEPVRWDRRVAWLRGRRGLRATRERLDAYAEGCGTTMVHPLGDARFLAALARHGGRIGYADRTAALRAIFGAELPERTITRRSKAEFSLVFWGPEARRFAEAWDGRGVDPALVDAEALRAEWLRPKPHAGAATLLGATWLQRAEDAGDGVE